MVGHVGFALGPGSQPGGGVDASGAPSVLKSTPADAVVSLAITVLLMNLTRNASCSETPPPSQPATLFATMLLMTVTSFQRDEFRGKAATSMPFTTCSRRPPPVPPSALLPNIRLLSMSRLRPVPSASPGAQSKSTVLPHSVPSGAVASGAAPRTARPPPLVGIVRFWLWLKMIQLCEMVPSLMKPECATPPASPPLM